MLARFRCPLNPFSSQIKRARARWGALRLAERPLRLEWRIKIMLRKS